MVIGAALNVWPTGQATRASPAAWGGGTMDCAPERWWRRSFTGTTPQAS
jgi:hypothetical protein